MPPAPTTTMTHVRPHATLLISIGLFFIALAPRLWALGWGLPYVEHPDEPALFETAIRMVQHGDWNPGRFLYPSLSYYLMAGVMHLFIAWHGMSASDIPTKTYFYTTLPDLYLWLRAITAILGAATVPLLYVLGRCMFGWQTGLLAAASLCLSAYHVEHSHFITTDAPTGLWVTMILLGAWSIVNGGGWRSYLLAGVATGLAAGTKYNAGVIGLVLVVAAGMVLAMGERDRRKLQVHLGGLVGAGLLAILVFLITTPYALLDMPTFRRDLAFNTSHYASGTHGDFIGYGRLDGYLGFFWETALLPSGSLLLLAGLGLLIRRSPRQFLILASATTIGLALLLTQAINFTRNTLPVFPPLFLLTAAATMHLVTWMRERLDRAPMPMLISLGLAGVLLVPYARGSVWLLNYWSQPYSLIQASTLLRTQPRGMLVAVESNPVEWSGDPIVEPIEQIANQSADWYRTRGYRYLLLNQDHYSSSKAPLYDNLIQSGIPLLILPSRRLGLQPGPGAAVIDLGSHPDRIPFTRRPIQFGNELDLLGYEIQPGELRVRISPLAGAHMTQISVGQGLQINLYWCSRVDMAINYTLFLHLYNEAGERVAQRDLALRASDYPTSQWQVGEVVIERGDMALPSLPLGHYYIEIGIYDAATGAVLVASSPTRLVDVVGE